MEEVLKLGADKFLRMKNTMHHDEMEFFKNWQLSDDVISAYNGIIGAYANWEYPCLEIFPGTGKSVQQLLAGEPLYIADWSDRLLDTVGFQFNRFYRDRRLRKKVIKGYDLRPLPQNSFGFVFCVNWLQFEDLHGLNNLACSVYRCLTPGGIYVFAFNPVDKHWGVDLIEQGFANGVDSKQLSHHLKLLGFEIVQMTLREGMNYVICKKPGTLTYIKSSSTVAKIIEKPKEL